METYKPRQRVERVIWELGGPDKVAQAMSVNRSTVKYWIRQNRLPPARQEQLLAYIDAVSAPVDVRDLIGG